MRYKIYNTITRQFIENDSDIILKPDGRIAVNDHGDEIELLYCVPLFFPTGKDGLYIDEIGGIHGLALNYNPLGDFCQDCYHITCSTCKKWLKERI